MSKHKAKLHSKFSQYLLSEVNNLTLLQFQEHIPNDLRMILTNNPVEHENMNRKKQKKEREKVKGKIIKKIKKEMLNRTRNNQLTFLIHEIMKKN